MIKHVKFITIFIILSVLLCLSSCKSSQNDELYPKEDSAGTGYGVSAKSALYIEDFYFLTVGTEKAKVDALIGSSHYNYESNELLPVYTLENGDSVAITYDSKKNTVTEASYTYAENMEKESFFDILVSLEILKSPSQETTGEDNTNIEQNRNPDIGVTPPSDGTQQGENAPVQIQPVTQGEIFATGAYNFSLIEPMLKQNMTRDNILSTIGKPNYFFSHSFKQDSYIIDCYNLSDGSKLYLDYGYERTNLRCAAIYKGGTLNSLLDSAYKEQTKPGAFTRLASDVKRVNRLTKNMTPAKVYAYIGEPAWYEGSRASYTDVFLLSDGSFAYLNFGSAHNKLTSLSIKGKNGKITVVNLK